MRDSVLRSAVPPGAGSGSGEFAGLGGFPLNVVSCPVGEFWLDSKFFRGKSRLAILDKLPFKGVDCIVGNDIGDIEGELISMAFAGTVVKDTGDVVDSIPVAPVTRSQLLVEPLPDSNDVNTPLDHVFLDCEVEVVNDRIPASSTEVSLGEVLNREKLGLVQQQTDENLKYLFKEAVDRVDSDELYKYSFVIEAGITLIMLFRISFSELFFF